MSLTNLLSVVVLTNSITLTNWINTGNAARRNNTNFVEQYMADITTTDWREEVRPVITYVTNRVPLKVTREVFSLTNSTVRMVPYGAPPLPPLPGAPTKM